MEQLKKDLLASWKLIQHLEEGELWRWHDGRIRYLLKLLYERDVSKERESEIQDSKNTRREGLA